MMIEKHMQFQSVEEEEKNLVAVDPLEIRFPKFKGKLARKNKAISIGSKQKALPGQIYDCESESSDDEEGYKEKGTESWAKLTEVIYDQDSDWRFFVENLRMFKTSIKKTKKMGKSKTATKIINIEAKT